MFRSLSCLNEMIALYHCLSVCVLALRRRPPTARLVALDPSRRDGVQSKIFEAQARLSAPPGSKADPQLHLLPHHDQSSLTGQPAHLHHNAAMSDISREDEERHSDSSFDEADDQDWADWVDDEDAEAQRVGLASGAGGSKSGNITYDPLSPSAGPSTTAAAAAGHGSFRVPTRALFADEKGQYEIFDSPVAALRRAKEQEGCDVVAVVKKLSEYKNCWGSALLSML